MILHQSISRSSFGPAEKTGLLLLTLLACTMLLCNYSQANDYTENIKILTDKLATAKTPAVISQTYVFRARNYFNKGDVDEAINDYNAAIAAHNVPWIWLEMGNKCLKASRFEQAKNIAELTQEKFPKFSPKEIANLKNKAESLLIKQQLQEHPPEIIYQKAAVKKLSRHDLIKQKKIQEAAKQAEELAAQEAAKQNNYTSTPNTLSPTPAHPDILVLPNGRRLSRFRGDSYIDPDSGTMYHMEGGLLVNNATGRSYFIK